MAVKRSKSAAIAVKYVDRRQIFSEHPLFRGMEPQEIDHLVANTRVEQFSRGKTIFRKGSPGTGMMAVLRGGVRICVTSASGKEATLNQIGPGEVFGEIALFDGRPRTADAVALADCDVLVLERRVFLPLMKANPVLALRIIEALCHKLRRTSEQVEDAFFLDLPERLLKVLFRLRDDQAGRHPRTGIVAVTQRELGEMIGISRESINKQLKAWQRAGRIRMGKGLIEIIDGAGPKRDAPSRN